MHTIILVLFYIYNIRPLFLGQHTGPANVKDSPQAAHNRKDDFNFEDKKEICISLAIIFFLAPLAYSVLPPVISVFF